jgi:hypothetical protein
VRKPTKTRKANKAAEKAPKATQPAYTIDENNALSIQFDNSEAYRSDTLYDKNSNNYALYGQSGHSLDNITGWWRKYELSDSYIIDTVFITYTKDNPDLPPSSVSKWYVERTVYELDPTWRQNSSNILSDKIIRGGVEMYGSFKSTRGIAYQGNEALTSYKPGDSSEDRSYARGPITEYGDYDTSKQARQWFNSYGDSKFFGKNWYLDPFGTNLI